MSTNIRLPTKRVSAPLTNLWAPAASIRLGGRFPGGWEPLGGRRTDAAASQVSPDVPTWFARPVAAHQASGLRLAAITDSSQAVVNLTGRS